MFQGEMLISRGNIVKAGTIFKAKVHTPMRINYNKVLHPESLCPGMSAKEIITCCVTGDVPSNSGNPVDPKLRSAKHLLRIPPSAFFKSFSVYSAGLAVLALALPEASLSAAFPISAWGTLEILYLRIAGATLVLSSAAEYCLADAAASGRLQSATYQRLLLGCLLKGFGNLAAFILVPSLWSPLLFLIYPAACILSILVNGGSLWASSKNPNKPVASMGMPPLPSSLIGWVYALVAMSFLAASTACYVPHNAALSGSAAKGPILQLLEHTCAPGLFLSALACLNLRDAADRGCLAASTFKRLNFALAGLSVASGLGLWASGLLRSSLVLLAPASTFLMCLWLGLNAKK